MTRSDIKPEQTQSGSEYFLFDAHTLAHVAAEFFDPASWREKNALLRTGLGRGATYIFKTDAEECVLRHYRRGGLPGRFLSDAYLWTGLANTRAWREWHLLMKMCQMDLPVPRPVAARVSRHGLYYCADIVTACLANTSALAERLGQGRLHAGVWQDIGACIRQFHDAGIFHADLNARNILLDQDDKVFLVDFDRGRQRHPDLAWQYANLNRLLRSLHKIQDREDVHYVAEADWSALMRGYWKNPESAAT